MAMKTECSECRGRGRYYRPRPVPMRSLRICSDDEIGATETFERDLVTCSRCQGVGQIERTSRVDVIQCGRKVGTVPPTFDPARIKSKSFLYDPRPGDFRWDGVAWVASMVLGPGDLEAVPGFAWDRKGT